MFCFKSKALRYVDPLTCFSLYQVRDVFFFFCTGNIPQSKQETIKRGIWRCSICTYDNDESLSVCDICGVLRNPLINYGPGSDKKTGMLLYLLIVIALSYILGMQFLNGLTSADFYFVLWGFLISADI